MRIRNPFRYEPRNIFANVLPDAQFTREMRGKITDAAGHAIRTDPRYLFIKDMQRHLIKCDPTMRPPIAWNIAARNLREFLADEGVSFGDPRFDWSPGARLT